MLYSFPSLTLSSHNQPHLRQNSYTIHSMEGTHLYNTQVFYSLSFKLRALSRFLRSTLKCLARAHQHSIFKRQTQRTPAQFPFTYHINSKTCPPWLYMLQHLRIFRRQVKSVLKKWLYCYYNRESYFSGISVHIAFCVKGQLSRKCI